MSQEPPNSQMSPSPKREPSGNSFQVAVKTQTVKLLRSTVGVLEGAIAQLEAEPATSADTSWWEPLQDGWSSVLGKIRSLLPTNLSRKLTNSALTGILAGTVVILVLTASNLFSSKPTEVAVAPSPASEPPAITTTHSPELQPPAVATPSAAPETPAVTTMPAPETEPSIITTTHSPELQPPAVATSPFPVAESSPVASPEEPQPNLSIPTELTAPTAPQPVQVIPPFSESMPTLVAQLTPEEILVATIQKQVEEISDRVADGLIRSIQPNFGGSNLVITLGNDWYDLESSQQDKLAAQMLERSRELDFSRLEAIDPKGNIVARSPVVGRDMIIFRRQNLSHTQ
jgi:hypothetical protein